MLTPFRQRHLLTLLNDFEQSTFPLDSFLNSYFRAHKAIGSKDRRLLSEMSYGLTRWRGLIDYLCPRPLSWENRIDVFVKLTPEKALEDQTIPSHVRISFPKALFEMISEQYGEENALEICLNSNQRAPLTIRVNQLKCTRDALFEKWNDQFDIVKTESAPYGITINERMQLFQLPEFKKGCFEVQDEGSQLIGEIIQAKPGEHILDYCAGSGGKTLAFAPGMQGTGQIYLHDKRKRALIEAKKRLCRAGIENAQIIEFGSAKLKKLEGKIDAVLLDVPCSGSGTLRRNPDLKWRFDKSDFQQLLQKQADILNQTARYVKPGGRLIYATCSLLTEENEKQIEQFINEHPFKVAQPYFKSLPTPGGMDGFFAAVLQKL